MASESQRHMGHCKRSASKTLWLRDGRGLCSALRQVGKGRSEVSAHELMPFSLPRSCYCNGSVMSHEPVCGEGPKAEASFRELWLSLRLGTPPVVPPDVVLGDRGPSVVGRGRPRPQQEAEEPDRGTKSPTNPKLLESKPKPKRWQTPSKPNVTARRIG